MPWSNLRAKPSRKNHDFLTAYKEVIAKWSGYLVAVTGSTRQLRNLWGYCGGNVRSNLPVSAT